MPWAFSQNRPLDTADFIREAGRRGIDLDISTIRELYRHRLLVPFVSITYRPVRAPAELEEPEPMRGGTRLAQLRLARDTGRLRDLADSPFMSRLAFERRRQRSRDWWNGLIYSWYQLLVLPEIDGLLSRRRYRRRDGHRIAWLPTPDALEVDRAQKLRDMAVVLTALEARYLPKLDPEWVRVSNAETDEWQRYRDSFDPVAMSTRLGYPATQARQDAEWLLARAHKLDPVGDSWSRLIRRAPSTAWEGLKDAALMAMDYRQAAEILLLFYEDLADHGQADPLPNVSGMSWHPLRERLSYREHTLDEDLTLLGISPHPRVVLAVEGETEQLHAPRVWKALGYPEAPELVRLLKLGGVGRDLKKVAALAAAPLVGEKRPGERAAWPLIKPPTRLLVAVDPEGPFDTPEKVEQERNQIIDEIKDVLKAQGVTAANPSELEELIRIETRSESCYEFAHFTDEELADGIMAVHHTINGWTRDDLVAALGYWRGRRHSTFAVMRRGLARPA
jgi:hypothetical protein